MKLIIFGATGSVGRELVKQALDHHYTVTAFVRDPTKLAGISHPHLYFVTGDVRDAAAVAMALEGQDAVCCVLGSGRKGSVRETGTKNIIAGMHQQGIQRLICQTTLGCGDSEPSLNFFWRHIMFGWFLKDAYRDHELQEQAVMESGLDWTIVRPAAFTNGEHTRTYQHGFAATEKSLQLKISRKDVADFILRQVKNAGYLYKAPGLSY